jgi:hypothetical protein
VFHYLLRINAADFQPLDHEWQRLLRALQPLSLRRLLMNLDDNLVGRRRGTALMSTEAAQRLLRTRLGPRG